MITQEQEKFISEYMPIHIEPLTTVECVHSGMRIAFEHSNAEIADQQSIIDAITEQAIKNNAHDNFQKEIIDKQIKGLKSDLRVCVEALENAKLDINDLDTILMCDHKICLSGFSKAKLCIQVALSKLKTTKEDVKGELG